MGVVLDGTDTSENPIPESSVPETEDKTCGGATPLAPSNIVEWTFGCHDDETPDRNAFSAVSSKARFLKYVVQALGGREEEDG